MSTIISTNNFTYETIEGEKLITGFTSTSSGPYVLNIDTSKFHGIKDSAFENRLDIETVKMSYKYDTDITLAQIENNLKADSSSELQYAFKIGNSAFAGCHNLKMIWFPLNMDNDSLGKWAFYDTNITNATSSDDMVSDGLFHCSNSGRDIYRSYRALLASPGASRKDIHTGISGIPIESTLSYKGNEYCGGICNYDGESYYLTIRMNDTQGEYRTLDLRPADKQLESDSASSEIYDFAENAFAGLLYSGNLLINSDYLVHDGPSLGRGCFYNSHFSAICIDSTWNSALENKTGIYAKDCMYFNIPPYAFSNMHWGSKPTLIDIGIYSVLSAGCFSCCELNNPTIKFRWEQTPRSGYFFYDYPPTYDKKFDEFFRSTGMYFTAGDSNAPNARERLYQSQGGAFNYQSNWKKPNSTTGYWEDLPSLISAGTLPEAVAQCATQGVFFNSTGITESTLLHMIGIDAGVQSETAYLDEKFGSSVWRALCYKNGALVSFKENQIREN